MTEGGIDYSALFAAVPAPCLVMDLDRVIVDVNDMYLRVTGRTREQLLGRYVFDAFPENPADLVAEGAQSLEASLQRVVDSRAPDTVPVFKHDIPLVGSPEAFEERWWSVINSPVIGRDGEVTLIIARVEDVTAYVQKSRLAAPPDQLSEGMQAMEAELYMRARELERINEELRRAHAEEREVALALQRSMLHAPAVEQSEELTVRYLPAASSLNVCGDWYDVADVSEEHLGAAVGDVVGHGLEAAVVMGMLRSALSAAIRASEGPARALEALGMYAESVEGAVGTTAVKVLINKRAHLIIYSSAGHPPPVLLHADGRYELLDKATDPPLGAWTEDIPRSQASLPYTPGDTLVLYTDGLIEQPGEDIDVGLARLTSALSRYVGSGPDHIADSILRDLVPTEGARDDIALLIICL